MFCLAALVPGGAHAQNVPRIKAEVVSFDGAVITVRPEGESDTMEIGIRPATRILKQEPKSLADLAPGQFIGATLEKSGLGVFSAQEVHVFPQDLRGSGEGLYPVAPGSNRFILNGAVAGTAASTISVKFRGASGEGRNCAGRAPRNPLDGCQGNATFAIPAGTPVMALASADKSLIKPGAVLALSLMAGTDGKPVTPGLTIETVATPQLPLPAPAAKTKSSRKPS